MNCYVKNRSDCEHGNKVPVYSTTNYMCMKGNWVDKLRKARLSRGDHDFLSIYLKLVPDTYTEMTS